MLFVKAKPVQSVGAAETRMSFWSGTGSFPRARGSTVVLDPASAGVTSSMIGRLDPHPPKRVAEAGSHGTVCVPWVLRRPKRW